MTATDGIARSTAREVPRGSTLRVVAGGLLRWARGAGCFEKGHQRLGLRLLGVLRGAARRRSLGTSGVARRMRPGVALSV